MIKVEGNEPKWAKSLIKIGVKIAIVYTKLSKLRTRYYSIMMIFGSDIVFSTSFSNMVKNNLG